MKTKRVRNLTRFYTIISNFRVLKILDPPQTSPWSRKIGYYIGMLVMSLELSARDVSPEIAENKVKNLRKL